MREILFRGKAINRDEGYHRTKYKNGDWVYGLITRLYDERFENLPAEMTNTSGISGIEIDYKTIGQYTGLTDKNGKKIFEGDIINAYHNRDLLNVSYVVFNRGEFWCELISGNFIDCCETLPEQETECGIEIIGNIYDNPELLKRGE